jgi:hypothetical protein
MQVIEYVQHKEATAWGECNGAPRGVQHPTEDILLLAPASFTFVKLLNGHHLLPGGGCIIRSWEHLVGHVHAYFFS